MPAASAEAGGLRLYHLLTADMRESVLLPLAMLKTTYPELHAIAWQKHLGRPWLPHASVSPLDCRWCDVVCLSPLVIYRELAGLGRRWGQPPRWFPIDASALRDLPATSFIPPPRLASDTARRLAFQPFAIEGATEPQTLPPATRLHFRAALKLRRRPLLFHRVPHVLVRGAVDVTHAVIEQFNEQDVSQPQPSDLKPHAAP